jgi:hypothetical protein
MTYVLHIDCLRLTNYNILCQNYCRFYVLHERIILTNRLPTG